ncbi:MAG: helix-turn-helix transcriptional regulator [Clostridia bacterium]|nr:helix-turn-helix transcriptional regulator [Clostridia bacterium]
MVEFGTLLRDLRKQSGLSQEQLAERIGVTKSVISYYELSERIPSPDVLIKISDVFHVTTDYLLGRDDCMTINVSDLPREDVELLKSIATTLRRKNQ